MTLPARLATASALALAAMLTAKTGSTGAYARSSEAALDVVATFSILGDLAARVGGDRANVVSLVGPGGDSHVYEPSPADAARTAEADVVVVNGLAFEGFIDRLIEASGTEAALVTATKGIEPLEAGEDSDEHDHKEDGHGEKAVEGHDDHGGDHAVETADAHGHDDDHHDHGPDDPHAWHSVEHIRTYVANIADGFCAADPDGCEAYRANASAYGSELDALAAELDATLGALPEGKRTLIVSHDAFGYLADAYGLTILAPQGLSTESEASAADVARLIDQIRADGAAAVFVENVADPRLIERIADETGIAVGGTLYSGALSEADGPAATYIDMMRHNATTIASAVAGS